MQKTWWAVIIIVAILLIGFWLYPNQNKSDELNNLPSQFENSPPGPPSLSQISNLNPETYSISIKDFAYASQFITIKEGDKVIWLNEDSAPHTVTSKEGQELDSNTLSKGATYSNTFDSPGTYNYYCTFHPGMTATIIVE